MTNWTPELVRAHLPDVTVKMNGKVYPAVIRGAKLDFAQVSILQSEHPWTLLPAFEVAWATLAHCLNTVQPISY